MDILNIPPEPTAIDLIAMFFILLIGLVVVAFILLFAWAVVGAIRYDFEARKNEKQLEAERRLKHDGQTVRS